MSFLQIAFYRYSLDQKITALIAIEFLGLLAIALVAYAQIVNLSGEIKQQGFVRFELQQSIATIRDQAASISTLNHRQLYLQAQRPGHSARILATRNELMQNFAQLQRYSSETRAIVEHASVERGKNELHLLISHHKNGLLEGLNRFDSQLAAYSQTVASQQPPGPDRDTSAIDLDTITLHDDQLEQALQQIDQQLELLYVSSSTHLRSTERVAIGYIILTSIVALLFIVAVVLLIVRMNISQPLQLLTDTINTFTAHQRVDESELEFALMRRRDELGRMSRSFNRLKHDLWQQGQALENARELAENANRGKSMFLAAASHDLRQPLNAMQMYIATLRSKVDDPAALRIIDDIDAVSLSTAGLLNALLDISQLEVGAIEPQYEDIAVQEILRRAHRSFVPIAQQKNLQLRLVPSSAWVHSDPVLLERILGNFLSNAIRYTDDGRVVIGCRRRGGRIAIEVVDSGCGIPDEQSSAIFEDFHQLDNSERDRGKGLGLGLAIARRLSKKLGHQIENSSVLGRGSRFAVLVDKADKKATITTMPHQTPQIDQPLIGIRVLLIEDNHDVLKATGQLLGSWGCEVYSAHDMIETEQLLAAKTTPVPDIIVADYRLPGDVNGIEVAGRVELMTGQPIPAVIVTGDVEKDHLKGLADQGHRVLRKPIRPAKLRALITHLTL